MAGNWSWVGREAVVVEYPPSPPSRDGFPEPDETPTEVEADLTDPQGLQRPPTPQPASSRLNRAPATPVTPPDREEWGEEWEAAREELPSGAPDVIIVEWNAFDEWGWWVAGLACGATAASVLSAFVLATVATLPLS